MRNGRRGATAWAFLCLALAACAAAPKRPDPIARGDYTYAKSYVSWQIRNDMRKHDVTGLSIALVDDQRVVWTQGFGYADERRGIRATPETVYRVGSISKLFTATAAMRLAEEGKLDIDRPLREVLPGFSIRSRFPDAGPVTPRGILTHHSGLPSDRMKGMWSRDPAPFTEVVREIHEESLAYPPGTVFSYSNLGMTLLGHAVTAVAGRDFSAHVDEAVLRPLGMAHSFFSPYPAVSPAASLGYRNGEEADEPGLRDVPAGGLNSTVLDLSRFLKMIFAGGDAEGGRILRPETVAEMLRPQNAGVPLDLDLRVGLGWMLAGLGDVNLRGAGPVAYHSGATITHRALLVAIPGYKLGVAVLANSAAAGPVVHRAAATALKLALEAKAGIRQPARVQIPDAERAAPPGSAPALAGRYASRAGLVEIRETGSGLRAEVMHRTFSLVPRADGLFALRYKVLGIFPVGLGTLDDVGVGREEVGGREILAARLDGKEFVVGDRIRPVPIPARWRERLGTYEIANPGDDFVLLERMRLREENGTLLVDYAMPSFFDGTMSMALAPLSDSEAVFCGLGRGLGETVRAVTVQGEERLRYSGYLLRRTRAE